MTEKKRPRGLGAAKTETIHNQHSAPESFVQARSRPILFSTHTGRTIVVGEKQTKRVARFRAADHPMIPQRSPDGMRRDALWVRETWRQDDGIVVYRVDVPLELEERTPKRQTRSEPMRWRPSIHMPLGDEEARAAGSAAVSPASSHCSSSARQRFALLWNQITARRAACSWDDNPSVYAIKFKVAGECARCPVAAAAEVHP